MPGGDVDGGGALAPVAGDGFVGGAAHDGLDQGGVVRPLAGQGVELLQGLVKDEVGRDHAQARVVAGALGVVVQRPREGLQPRQIGLGVLGRGDLVLGVEEGGNRLVGAGQLAQDVRGAGAVVAEVEGAVGRVLRPQAEDHRLVVDARQAVQARGVEALQAGEFGGGHRLVGGDARQRSVGELEALAG
jgi:hypothetical protein